MTYSPPTEPPKYAKPLANARYLRGRISDGMAWTIAMVGNVVPMSMPPPMSMLIDVALADMTAPANAINGGNAARYFLFSTSESRPTVGERTLCMRSGPWAHC